MKTSKARLMGIFTLILLLFLLLMLIWENKQEASLYPVNENGQTYGSALSNNPPPDLIATIGDSGVEGYVYYDEMFPTITAKTPEEAQEELNSFPQKIPVYKSDGITQIDTFTFDT